jgi:hypothetical protein
MSQERLQLLKAGLVRNGWAILPGDGQQGLFELHHDAIRWKITHSNGECLELKIFAASGLGGPPTLRDILSCEVLATGRKMYFGKLNDVKWRTELDIFLGHLQREPSHD